MGTWVPRIDVSETNQEIRVKLDVPNVDPDKINIEVGDDILTVSGRTEEEKKEEGETWYREERQTGEFERTMTLPAKVDKDRVQANAHHGCIMITLPKVEETEKRKIQVSNK